MLTISNFPFYLKILKIFNHLAVSSEKLCRKLFLIVFNTPRFVEGGCLGGATDESMSRKIKGILMANRSSAQNLGGGAAKPLANNAHQHFEIFIEFFTRFTRIQLVDRNNDNSSTTTNGNSELRVNHPHMLVLLSEYLLNLFKVSSII